MLQELQDGTREHQNATVVSNHPDVRASVVIEAEWPRVLNAITVPEYLDVWLTMPGVERLECCAEQRTLGGFRIDVFAAGALQRAIYGACIRSKPDEVSYLWERNRAESVEKSLVKLRVRGGTRRCSLYVKHRGLWDQEERDWYSMMWQESLNKLRVVMEKRSSINEGWASI
jgi:uncharacterized protein YndB with AHSA1/START domain